jgi:UDP-glucose:glycoprotein glucosyltransferase
VLTSRRLLKLLRKEKDMISSLVSMGLTAEQAIDLVSHSAISSAQRESGKLEGIFDASDRAEGGGVITWLNDIETDSRYVFLLSSCAHSYFEQLRQLESHIANGKAVIGLFL